MEDDVNLEYGLQLITNLAIPVWQESQVTEEEEKH